ncbi:YceI-like domain-containing protein [Gracilimonas mengyeensis]|uniref:YceI-like domain-containing protein n=1 Tax=Gracilimonas mengyeensis TaxID=1302730 RepID=A0A521AIH2_9BACT|nr:YceI-like domain-containing protein [Gracilimonas mengyeensis]
MIPLLILVSHSMALGQAFMTDSGTAVFHSEVPLHTFSGSSDFLTGRIDLEDKTVDFYLDLHTLETGIDKRDRDMLETLEAEEFPFAEFFGKLTSNFDPENTSPQTVTVEGDFKIHGVTNETKITGTLQMTDNGLLVKAGWTLLLKDYDIEPPKLLFVKVDQQQDIEIEALLKPVED